MKYLITSVALTIAAVAMGQMPYNPDANGDDLIGSEDLLSFLGLYSTIMVDSSLTCSYEGTELESLVGGLFDGNYALDSVYVEYLIVDTVTTFLPGCPDPVEIETVLERGYMGTLAFSIQYGTFVEYRCWDNYLGYDRMLRLRFFDDSGLYSLEFEDEEVAALTGYSEISQWNGSSPECCSSQVPLPFPVSWTLDEDGIQVDWNQDQWVANCEHFRLIPFWSVAQ